MDGTSGVYWSIKPNILKGHVWFLPKPNEFLQILYWKLGEFVLEIGIEFTGNLEHGLPFVKRNPRRGWCVTEAAAMAWAEVGGEG